MPQIIPIKDLKNTSEISDMCHRAEEPIYITKNPGLAARTPAQFPQCGF